MMLPFLVFLLGAFIGGALNGIFVRFVSLEFGPFTGTFLRFSAAAIILFPFWLRKKETIVKHDIVKFLPFSINMALFSIAIQHTGIIMYNILYALVPLFVAFLAFFLLGERLLRHHIVGLMLSVLGIAILIKGSLETSDILTFGKPLGNTLVLLGAFVWSFWVVGARSMSKKYTWFTIIFFAFLTTTIILALLIPFEWFVRPPTLSSITTAGLGSLIGVIFLSTILLYFLYQWLIGKTSAFIASLMQYGAIVFGSLSGPFVFHERFTTELVVGAFLVIVGVFLATTYTQLKKRM